ncbi:MAG: hypothetical protein AAB863_01730 [Patescibacteria group bacterium]
MSPIEFKKIYKMADESIDFARKSMQRANDLRVYLSLLDYKFGKTNTYKSVRNIFKKLKIA